MEDSETVPDFQLLTNMDDETIGFLEQLFTNEIELEDVAIHVIPQNTTSIGTKAKDDQPQDHYPADVAINPKPRFVRVSDEELQSLTCKDCRQSDSTKRNTKWAIQLFQDWSKEVLGETVDFSTISPETLSDNLSKFYAETTPKFTDTREKQMSVPQAQEYHKNSVKSIRAGVNRHLRDLDRDVDIVRDKAFRKSNDILDGKMQQNSQNGLSRPTKHKEIILESDLKKINLYLFSE